MYLGKLLDEAETKLGEVAQFLVKGGGPSLKAGSTQL